MPAEVLFESMSAESTLIDDDEDVIEFADEVAPKD